jgi:uracil-DNA glycosylase
MSGSARKASRLFVVGEAPSDRAFQALESRNGSRAEKLARRLALTGDVGRRLAGLLGEEWPSGLLQWQGPARYVLRNLQDVPWSRRAFDLERARLAAASIALEASQADGVVLALGPLVAQAFNVRGEPLRWSRPGALAGWTSDVLVGTFPEPSRRNRFWHDRKRAEEALAFARATRRGLELGIDPRGLGGWVLGLEPDLAESGAGELFETRELAEAAGLELGLRRFWTGRMAVSCNGAGVGDPMHLLAFAWLSISSSVRKAPSSA